MALPSRSATCSRRRRSRSGIVRPGWRYRFLWLSSPEGGRLQIAAFADRRHGRLARDDAVAIGDRVLRHGHGHCGDRSGRAGSSRCAPGWASCSRLGCSSPRPCCGRIRQPRAAPCRQRSVVRPAASDLGRYVARDQGLPRHGHGTRHFRGAMLVYQSSIGRIRPSGRRTTTTCNWLPRADCSSACRSCLTLVLFVEQHQAAFYVGRGRPGDVLDAVRRCRRPCRDCAAVARRVQSSDAGQRRRLRRAGRDRAPSTVDGRRNRRLAVRSVASSSARVSN